MSLDMMERWVADTYGFSTQVRCEAVQRTAAQIIRVVVAGEPYWLRLSRQSLEQAQAEARGVDLLHRRGASVAPPVRRTDGDLVGLVELSGGPQPALMCRNAPGLALEMPTPAQAAFFGMAVAQIHSAGSHVEMTHRPVITYRILAEEPLAHVAQWFVGREDDLRRLQVTAEGMQRVIWGSGSLGPSEGFCHGDIHLGNARFTQAHPTIFDFEVSGKGPLVYDLACYWRKRLLAQPTEASWEQEWSGFLQGYRTVRPISQEELSVIPALATLRAIWTMALPAFPGVTWGIDWLRDSTYFGAHCKMIHAFAEKTGSQVLGGLTRP